MSLWINLANFFNLIFLGTNNVDAKRYGYTSMTADCTKEAENGQDMKKRIYIPGQICINTVMKASGYTSLTDALKANSEIPAIVQTVPEKNGYRSFADSFNAYPNSNKKGQESLELSSTSQDALQWNVILS